jgi:hypothetical protein
MAKCPSDAVNEELVLVKWLYRAGRTKGKADAYMLDISEQKSACSWLNEIINTLMLLKDINSESAL